MMEGVDCTEPPVWFIEDWATGLVNVFEVGAVVAQYVNWAYVYLGYDNPNYESGDFVHNQAICFMTEACRYKLKELENDC